MHIGLMGSRPACAVLAKTTAGVDHLTISHLGEDEQKMLRLIARSEGLFVAYCRRREARVCKTRLSFRGLVIILAERRAVARELFSCG
eukprot:scaffold9001_cov127-Isochrysis_galbana.AAC.5